MSNPGPVSLKPPTPTAKAVRAHRQTLELSLAALKQSAAELALASARGKAGAKDALAALYLRLRATEFEINCNHAAAELASQQDAAAEIAWRAGIQCLDPEEVIAGISKDGCCGRCTPGSPGGCVITASAPYAGGTCGHPIREKHLFHLNDQGRRIFRYRDNPQASRIFDAACKRLGVAKEYV
jgi:hypothetical protein